MKYFPRNIVLFDNTADAVDKTRKFAILESKELGSERDAAIQFFALLG